MCQEFCIKIDVFTCFNNLKTVQVIFNLISGKTNCFPEMSGASAEF